MFLTWGIYENNVTMNKNRPSLCKTIFFKSFRVKFVKYSPKLKTYCCLNGRHKTTAHQVIQTHVKWILRDGARHLFCCLPHTAT